MTHDRPRLIQRAECDYSLVRGVNISSLLYMGVSPKHYRDYLQHGGIETRQMSLGTAAHAAVLEPLRFQTEFAVWDKEKKNGDMAARKGKDWDAFVAEHAGQTIITPAEHEHACAIAGAVRSDALAMRYLSKGEPEVSLQWTDRETGILCKGRIDWDVDLEFPHACIIDLKTARDVSSWGFCSSASKLDYHTRMAWYADGYEEITGRKPDVIVVAVEPKRPYDVVCYNLEDDPELDTGRDEYRRLLDRLAQCTRDNEWPGIGNGQMQRFELAKWKRNDNESLEDMGLDWTGKEP